MVHESKKRICDVDLGIRFARVLAAVPFQIILQRDIEELVEFAIARAENAVDVVDRGIRLGTAVERILAG
jgi:hypothetical protein